MKDNLSNKNNEIFKNIMSQLDSGPEYDLELEDKIMDKIGLESDHAVIIQKYKRWSRIGFVVSIILLLVLFAITFYTAFNSADVEIEEMGMMPYMPSLFAVIGLILLYVQIELRKNTYARN